MRKPSPLYKRCQLLLCSFIFSNVPRKTALIINKAAHKIKVKDVGKTRSKNQIATPSIITPKTRLILSIHAPTRGNSSPELMPITNNGTPNPRPIANNAKPPNCASPV